MTMYIWSYLWSYIYGHWSHPYVGILMVYNSMIMYLYYDIASDFVFMVYGHVLYELWLCIYDCVIMVTDVFI